VPSQTLLGSGTATLDPTSMTAEWSVPTQDLVEVGVIAAPAAIADWTTPAQTIVVSGSATLTSTPSIFTWVVPAQHFVGEGPNPPGSRRRAGNRAHYQVNG
jgi:hypothetical protein